MNGATVKTTMDRLASGELDRQLDLLKVRLAEEFGGDRVGAVLDEERGRFAAACIHSFLTILIERSVRARLTDAQRSSSLIGGRPGGRG